MLTRVRIEAEAKSLAQLEKELSTASDALMVESLGSEVLNTLYGKPDHANARRGLAEARAGEFVIERGSTDQGGLRYIGRIVHHFAIPEARGKLLEGSPGAGMPFHED